MNDKFITTSIVLSIIFAITSIFVYIIEGIEVVVLPTFMTLTGFFFIIAMMASLDFGEELIIDMPFCDNCSGRDHTKCKTKSRVEEDD